MRVKGNDNISEVLAKKLFGIESVPKEEQKKMVSRAIKAAREMMFSEIKRKNEILLECLPFVNDALDDPTNKQSAKPKIRATINRILMEILEAPK